MTSILNNLAYQFAINVLQCGQIPHHVGFIMDGNRRYGRKLNVGTTQGYYLGYDALLETLVVCFELGVRVVTAYAFSIENFNRPSDQVQVLMDLLKTRILEMNNNNEIVKKYNICVRVLGDISLLPDDVREAVISTVDLTKNNNGVVLNLCLPYTSREELTMATRSIADDIKTDGLHLSDVTASLLQETLYTRSCPPMDLLIRTSGEIRLSDFMLWQAGKNCHVEFIDCYWPEFSFWRMVPALIRYQLRARSIAQSREVEVQEDTAQLRISHLENDQTPSPALVSGDSMPEICAERKGRFSEFLTHRGQLQHCPIVRF